MTPLEALLQGMAQQYQQYQINRAKVLSNIARQIFEQQQRQQGQFMNPSPSPSSGLDVFNQFINRRGAGF